MDTGQQREAAGYIRTFTSRYDEDTAFAKRVNTGWMSPANACIDGLLAGDNAVVEEQLNILSSFQLRELPDYIPAAYHQRWQHDHYLLKLCGAGGGGMLLGYLKDLNAKPAVETALGKVEWL